MLNFEELEPPRGWFLLLERKISCKVPLIVRSQKSEVRSEWLVVSGFFGLIPVRLKVIEEIVEDLSRLVSSP